MQVNKQKIISHIKRLQGQLESVKKLIDQEGVDCEQATQTLFAASRSLASLRQEFVKCQLEKSLDKKVLTSKKYSSLLNLIKG